MNALMIECYTVSDSPVWRPNGRDPQFNKETIYDKPMVTRHATI